MKIKNFDKLASALNKTAEALNELSKILNKMENASPQDCDHVYMPNSTVTEMCVKCEQERFKRDKQS